MAIKSQSSNHTQTSPITDQRWLSDKKTLVGVIKSLLVLILSLISFMLSVQGLFHFIKVSYYFLFQKNIGDEGGKEETRRMRGNEGPERREDIFGLGGDEIIKT